MERDAQKMTAENVLCFIEGSDPVLKNEIVVISAHYDHIGITNGEINNGADDDGSGTVGTLELAEAFIEAKKAGMGTRRSILILNVSGEEKGLLGSEWYSDFPVFPLTNTVCDLNIDMIGRKDDAHSDGKYIYLIGSDKLSTDLHKISENCNSTYTNLALDYTYNNPDDPNRFYYRSDHYNFAKHNIPVIFYFSGVHEDYHKPGDDVEKIMFDKMTTICKLIFHTAWEVANRDEKLKVDVQNNFEND
jgi:Zn-dependent M28 family amino/carboxypeptidase